MPTVVVDLITEDPTILRARSVKIDHRKVKRFAEAMKDGAIFPPITIATDVRFHPNEPAYWIIDGFHRLEAMRKAGIKEAHYADREVLNLRQALWAALTHAHGYRSKAEKQSAVRTILADPEWSQMSNRAIAEKLRVDSSTVDYWRERVEKPVPPTEEPQTYVDSVGRKMRLREGFRSKEKLVEEIFNMAGQGMEADQIAAKLDITRRYLISVAAKNNISLLTRRQVGVKPSKDAMEQTILGLDASAAAIRTIGLSLSNITKEQAKDWEQSLGESIRTFNALRRKLKEFSSETQP